MKNILYYRSIALALLTLCLSSCNKYLDTTPDNRAEINTEEKIAQLIGGAYPQASYAAMLNSRVDYVTDKGKGTEHDSNTYPFFWRDVENQSQDTPNYFWNKCYYSVAEVNHAIEAIEKLGKPSTLDPYYGEALLIRSFSHFLVVSLYSKFYDKDSDNATPGVPYVTEPEKVVVKKYDRETVQKTWEKVETDLTEGLKYIGSDAIYQVPRYHFTMAAANAFATRFYLYKGDWNKVISHASAVIPVPVPDESGWVKSDDPANVYAANNFQPWLTEYASMPSSTEIKAKYTKADNSSNLLLTEMPSRLSRNANSWRYGCNNSDVSNTVKAKNATGGVWGFRTFSNSSTHYYVPKYREHFVRESINASTGTIYTIFPHFRNEEVLLNRAEAYAMTDNLNAAVADLNVYCRQRIKGYNETNHKLTVEKLIKFFKNEITLPDHYFTKYNAFGSSSWSEEKKAVVLFILECRRNEFMWEGLRYWDMVRYKIPVTHMTVSGEENTLYPGDDRWVLQIPEAATLSGVEPNPRTNLLSREW